MLVEMKLRYTIPKAPNMIAIKPPVLVPQIKSKHSQGFKFLSSSFSSMPLIISRNIRSEDRPLTPPPSSERILGILEGGGGCAIQSVEILSRHEYQRAVPQF